MVLPVDSAVPTRWWHRLPDGRIACDLCPRGCRLRAGQRGLCFVREARPEGIVLTAWGRSSGFCVDPIEKKPLHHFLPGTATLSFGTAGCNLTCRFCQNWSISKARETEALCEAASPEQIAAAAAALGCRSVSFTYNDPVVFLEWAVDVARACRARGLRTIAVTAGYVEPGPRAELFRWIDAANVDLKSFRDAFYRRMATASLAPVLDTLRWIRHETATWLEITTLLIPGENDGDREIEDLSTWVAEELGPDVPLHFTAFHPAWRLPDREPTPPATLSRARFLARRAGLRHVYTGNVVDPEGAATRCHACGRLLVARRGHAVTAWSLRPGGRCPCCGAPCPGVWEDRPGSGSGRRRPVRLEEAGIQA